MTSIDSTSVRAMGTLRRHLLRNRIVRLSRAPKPRFLMALFAALSLWGILFAAFFFGFEFLDQHGLVSGYLIEMVFGLFFATLTVMLVFSTGILTYASLFASPEARFLLVRPLTPDRIFSFKFQEAFFFGSWAFFVVGSPLMVAYGLSSEAPASFYLIALLFFASFGLLPSCLGSLLCLAINALFPRRRKEVLGLLAVFFIGMVLYRGLRVWESSQAHSLDSLKWVSQFIVELDVGRVPLLPSHWMSRGVLAASREGGLQKALMFLLVTISQGAMAYLLTTFAYRKGYRRAYDRVHSHRSSRRRSQTSISSKFVSVLFGWLPRSMRALIAKDLKTFARDPVQSLQLLVFSGLMVLYVVALSRFKQIAHGDYWQIMLGFLNLGIMAPFLSILASRFIFPLLSLEAQKIWILGQTPVPRRQILWSKFLFSTAGSLILATTLTLGSAWVIGVQAKMLLVHLGAICLLSPGVCGIAVGLGGRFLELNESDPGKIASGLPGAINMILSMTFILLVVIALAIPFHLDASRPPSLEGFPFGLYLSLSFLVSLALTAMATFIPMRIGLRYFSAKEL